jgi:hypothetical protein
MSAAEKYDVLVLGSGTAGKVVPWTIEGEPPSWNGSISAVPVPMWHAARQERYSFSEGRFAREAASGVRELDSRLLESNAVGEARVHEDANRRAH